jgi:hypothetical protein
MLRSSKVSVNESGSLCALRALASAHRAALACTVGAGKLRSQRARLDQFSTSTFLNLAKSLMLMVTRTSSLTYAMAAI